jgi:hypothetical protein
LTTIAGRGRRRAVPGAATAALVAFALYGGLVVETSCQVVIDIADPVHSDQITAVGSDPSGERPGPTHRPGQPCLVCHGSDGPNNPELSVAGTVYRSQVGTIALQGAVVTLTDAQGRMQQLDTNRTGNLLVQASAWQPVYPMRVAVSYAGVNVEMKTEVGREGSCAACHTDPAGPASAGHIYLVADPATFPSGGP